MLRFADSDSQKKLKMSASGRRRHTHDGQPLHIVSFDSVQQGKAKQQKKPHRKHASVAVGTSGQFEDSGMRV